MHGRSSRACSSCSWSVHLHAISPAAPAYIANPLLGAVHRSWGNTWQVVRCRMLSMARCQWLRSRRQPVCQRVQYVTCNICCRLQCQLHIMFGPGCTCYCLQHVFHKCLVGVAWRPTVMPAKPCVICLGVPSPWFTAQTLQLSQAACVIPAVMRQVAGIEFACLPDCQHALGKPRCNCMYCYEVPLWSLQTFAGVGRLTFGQ